MLCNGVYRDIMKILEKDALNADFRTALRSVAYERGGIPESSIREASIDLLSQKRRSNIEDAWREYEEAPVERRIDSYDRFMRVARREISHYYRFMAPKLRERPTAAVY